MNLEPYPISRFAASLLRPTWRKSTVEQARSLFYYPLFSTRQCLSIIWGLVTWLKQCMSARDCLIEHIVSLVDNDIKYGLEDSFAPKTYPHFIGLCTHTRRYAYILNALKPLIKQFVPSLSPVNGLEHSLPLCTSTFNNYHLSSIISYDNNNPLYNDYHPASFTSIYQSMGLVDRVKPFHTVVHSITKPISFSCTGL